MLITPLGQIKIYGDDAALDYVAMAHTFEQGPVKDHPIAGCYRIHIPVRSYKVIRCEVELADAAIPNTGASGERYMDAEFIYGTTILTIGAEDENPAFETVCTEHGMEYRILGSVTEVVFGIAWTMDYEGSLVSTADRALPALWAADSIFDASVSDGKATSFIAKIPFNSE